MRGRTLVVGENNPYSVDPKYALWPDPPRSAGGRLCRVILGMRVADYVGAFERVNLLSEAKWSAKKAGEAADDVLDDIARYQGAFVYLKSPRKFAPRVRLILLGQKVAKAFGLKFEPFKAVGTMTGGVDFLMLPHPSGRCRIWNDRLSIVRARAAVTEFCPELKGKLGKADE